MSETIKQHEHAPDNANEKYEISNDAKKEHREHHIKTPEKPQEKVEALQEKVEKQHPTKSAELLDQLEPIHSTKAVHPPNKELKRIALSNYLSDIRSNLGSGSKAFSKFIHKPSVDAISEVAGKTIVRPTAILFGGLFMFIGSSLYLYATYSTNAKYNFFVAVFLFVGGFVAGVVVELFYNLFFKKSL